jgi:hypothetical protein
MSIGLLLEKQTELNFSSILSLWWCHFFNSNHCYLKIRSAEQLVDSVEKLHEINSTEILRQAIIKLRCIFSRFAFYYLKCLASFLIFIERQKSNISHAHLHLLFPSDSLYPSFFGFHSHTAVPRFNTLLSSDMRKFLCVHNYYLIFVTLFL